MCIEILTYRSWQSKDNALLCSTEQASVSFKDDTLSPQSSLLCVS